MQAPSRSAGQADPPGRQSSRERSSTPGPRHGSSASLPRHAALNSAAAVSSALPQPGTQVHSAEGCTTAQQPAGQANLVGSAVAAAADVCVAELSQVPLPPASNAQPAHPGLEGQVEPGSVPQAVAGSAADSGGGGGRPPAQAAAAAGAGLPKPEPLAQAELLGLPVALQAEQCPSNAQNRQDHGRAEQQETATCLGAAQQAAELQGQQAGAFCTHAAPVSAAPTTRDAPHDPGKVQVQPARDGTARAATARAASMPRASSAAQEVTSPDPQRQDRRGEKSSSGDESHPLMPAARRASGAPGSVESPKVRRHACCGQCWRLTPAWL